MTKQLRIIHYNPDYYSKWNEFIKHSENGTLFHRLDFLDYHKEKFASSEKHLIWMKGDNNIIAVMPLALFSEKNNLVGKSPYGASYGGIVHKQKLTAEEAIDIVKLLTEYLSGAHIQELVVIPPILPYFNQYTNYIEFAMFSQGFVQSNRMITSIVKIPENQEQLWQNVHSKTRNIIRKANNLFKQEKEASLVDFYKILLEDKARNHSKPTHSMHDLEYLMQKFPDKIYIEMASFEGKKAGICYFELNVNCLLTFYMAQGNGAVGYNGLNFLIYKGLLSAMKKGYKYIDFGTSLMKDTAEQNIFGLVKFKDGFGSRGYFREVYTWRQNEKN